MYEEIADDALLSAGVRVVADARVIPTEFQASYTLGAIFYIDA